MNHRKISRIPSYRLHKPSGRAVVTLNGRDHYLGKHGTDASRQAYERLIASWLKGNRQLPATIAPDAYTVATLCDQFLDWAEREYVRADGSQSREIYNVKLALRPLLELFAHQPAAQFGPKDLMLYREGQIDLGLARTTIN